MARILFAGDWHGNRSHVTWCLERAQSEKVDLVIQLGDFGWFPKWDRGVQFIEHVRNEVLRTKQTVWFVDGNHDDHPDLRALPLDENGFGVAGENLRYLPRNTRFEFSGLKMLAHGGALSVDSLTLNPGIDWWPEEKITEQEVAAVSSETVDVLITHEAPTGRIISYKDDIHLSVQQRERVREIAEKVSPTLIVHGHHHTRYTARYEQGWTVVGTGRDGQKGQSIWIMDTGQFTANRKAADEQRS